MTWFGHARCLLPVVTATILVGCQSRNAFVPPPPPDVTVAHPVTEPVVETVEFSGNTRATDSVQLRARVNGYLKSIHFEDGAHVKKGDLLFVIEPDQYEVALQSARASLEKAKASLALAEIQLARSRQLVKTNSVAQAEIDVEVAERDSAAAEVATAESAVKQAELNLGYTQVRSPLNGRIGRHLVDIGNLIQTEATQLATIEAYDPIHVYFTISESEYLRFSQLIRENAIPNPDKNKVPLRIGMPNQKGFPYEGYLDYRDFGVDPETGTLLRRGTFKNDDGSLVPGMFVRIRAEVGKPVPKVLVEERAIATDQRGDYVLVVNKDDVVEYRPITLGQIDDGRRVVESGISIDDWVIVNGIQRARPGAKVKPAPEGEPSRLASEPKDKQASTGPATVVTSAKG